MRKYAEFFVPHDTLCHAEFSCETWGMRLAWVVVLLVACDGSATTAPGDDGKGGEFDAMPDTTPDVLADAMAAAVEVGQDAVAAVDMGPCKPVFNAACDPTPPPTHGGCGTGQFCIPYFEGAVIKRTDCLCYVEPVGEAKACSPPCGLGWACMRGDDAAQVCRPIHFCPGSPIGWCA
jgi:hypothetical protein